MENLLDLTDENSIRLHNYSIGLLNVIGNQQEKIKLLEKQVELQIRLINALQKENISILNELIEKGQPCSH